MNSIETKSVTKRRLYLLHNQDIELDLDHKLSKKQQQTSESLARLNIFHHCISSLQQVTSPPRTRRQYTR